MTIQTNIIGNSDSLGGGKRQVDVHPVTNGAGTHSGLVTLNAPLVSGEPLTEFFVNPNYGIAMNQNGLFGGTPDQIHDGTDSTLWTASSIQGGKFTFDSTDQADSGTKSIKTDNASVNDIMQLAKGSDVDLNNYTAITMRVYVDKDWELGDVIEMYGYDTASAMTVGSNVSLGDYFDFSVFDEWQTITIPLSDMNIDVSTIVDAFRIQIIASSGKSPKFYLDSIQIEETGTPITFQVPVNQGNRFHVDELIFSIADNIGSTLTDGTMPGLSYDAFLGLGTLTNGLVFRRSKDGISIFNIIIRGIVSLLAAGASIDTKISDGTNTFITIRVRFKNPLILEGGASNSLTLQINDDMTGLQFFTASAIGFIELPPGKIEK